jgi:hypothetical protein
MMELIKAADGMELAHDWVADILKRSERDLTDDDLTMEEAARFVGGDINAILQSNVLWLLIPTKPTTGAWVEYGIGIVARRLGNATGTERWLICSGGESRPPIFTVAANHVFRTDKLAFQWLKLQVPPPPGSQGSEE